MENGSDVGGNSIEDEGIGRSTLSADVTTATWGGSTQMSSTQNDSAVSDEGSSNETDEEVIMFKIPYHACMYIRTQVVEIGISYTLQFVTALVCQ